jgi:hypothetical protein
MDLYLIDHTHAKLSWITLRINRRGETKMGLVVETDLTLNTADWKYDAADVKSLVECVTTYLECHDDIEGADINPSREDDAVHAMR